MSGINEVIGWISGGMVDAVCRAGALSAWLVAVLVSAPVFFVAAECLLGLLPRRRTALADRAPRYVIVIPAHDEETRIAGAVGAARASARGDVRTLVVADNCCDSTAQRAHAAGAEVLRRDDDARRGKGYAIAHAVGSLASDPPEVVVFIDADCHPEGESLDVLARAVAASGRPAQAVYLMTPPDSGGLSARISALAFAIKNFARPIGLHRVGAPILLTGTGMAVPYRALRQVPLAVGDIVEDMRLGIDLAVAGFPAALVPEARITSRFPDGEGAALVQRTRWEHGHLSALFAIGPRLLKAFARRPRLGLLLLFLELAVPPLALLMIVAVATLVVLAAAAFLGSGIGPVASLCGAIVLLFVALILVIRTHLRGLISAWILFAAPLYALRKVPLYLRWLTRPEKRWIRTDRSGASANDQTGPRKD